MVIRFLKFTSVSGADALINSVSVPFTDIY